MKSAVRPWLVLAVLAFAACDQSGTEITQATPDASTLPPTPPGPPNPPPTPPPDGGPVRRTSCLDRPTDLSRAPASPGQLPCELIPPGLTL